MQYPVGRAQLVLMSLETPQDPECKIQVGCESVGSRVFARLSRMYLFVVIERGNNIEHKVRFGMRLHWGHKCLPPRPGLCDTVAFSGLVLSRLGELPRFSAAPRAFWNARRPPGLQC